MMEESIISAETIFKETGAIMEGHFLLTSGLHSPTYLEKFRILQNPHYTEQLCSLIAHHFRKHGVQVVAGPTMGGIILAFEVARQLGVRSIFAERNGNKRVFRRGLTLTRGEQVLVVDDILTTGDSLREVIAEVRRQGAEVVGAGVLADRTQDRLDIGVSVFACCRISIPTYQPGACPLCAAGIPLEEPGGKGTLG
jgi:orotate phosphoribosyltransferase